MSWLMAHRLPVLAAVFVAVGITGWAMTYDLSSEPAAQNRAVVDTSASAALEAEVSRGLVQVLSYDYADPEATAAAADAVLAGAAREEYDTLFASLQERAPDQQLVLSAEVQAVGVKELSDGAAELLVFLDQRSQRVDDDEASVSAAQLAITAERRNGVWVITRLQPL